MGTKLSNRRGGFPAILQHDSGLRPDACGGPLVDIDGKAVGINIARAGRTETYAIPSDDIGMLLPRSKKGDFAVKEEAVKTESPAAKEPEPFLRKSLSLAKTDKFDKERQRAESGTPHENRRDRADGGNHLRHRDAQR